MKSFWRDETAATAIEYSLIGGLIALVMIPEVFTIGQTVQTKFNFIFNTLFNS